MNQALFDAAVALKPEPKTEFQPIEEKVVSTPPHVVSWATASAACAQPRRWPKHLLR